MVRLLQCTSPEMAPRVVSRRRSNSVASLIGHSGSSAFRPSTTAVCRYHSRARASLRNRPEALPSWGFEDEAEQSFGRPCQQANGRSKRPSELTSSIVPRGTSFHRRVEFGFLLSHLILYDSHAAATSRVQRKSVPSTQMRCRITANRRASATIAFLIPRCRAIFIAQALSQDHLLVRVSMTWAAS